MSGDLSDINWDDIPEPTERASNGPLAAGTYPVRIENASVKLAKSGNGKYVEVQFRVTDGIGANRCVWARLNHQNANETAARIGMAQLKKLAAMCGLTRLTDTSQLIDSELCIDVTAREYNGNVYNDVKDFSKAGSAASKPKSLVLVVENDPEPQSSSGGSADDVPW
jgi:hypothetical protein